MFSRTIVLSFKAADHSLLQIISSLLLPVGGKNTFGNTQQCLVPLLDFLSDLILAVAFLSHQDDSALKDEATCSLSCGVIVV